MSAGLELPHVSEVQVLRDQNPSVANRRSENGLIISSGKRFRRHRMNVVFLRGKQSKQLIGQILVELDFHAMAGSSGSGKSSCADAAANAMTALTCSSLSVGKLLTICSTESPSASD